MVGRRLTTEFLIYDILFCFNAQELRLMRNEVFARHGYIFKTNEMREYFSSQDWYEPKFDDVNHLLTDLEKVNILLIKRIEKKKNQ